MPSRSPAQESVNDLASSFGVRAGQQKDTERAIRRMGIAFLDELGCKGVNGRKLGMFILIRLASSSALKAGLSGGVVTIKAFVRRFE